MKLSFESNLQYQQDAIQAVVGLFEGQTKKESVFQYNMNGTQMSLIDGVGNNLALSEEQIMANLQKVQRQNEIPVSYLLDGMHFSVEMETGTGKTYVYLRTIYELNKQGIKVLSLFFIDRVANYRTYDTQGNEVKGKFALWFEDIYSDLIKHPEFQSLNHYELEKIHNGYFSQDKKGHVRDTSGETQADDNTYNLIMKDKETLLDMNNPLRFIFSHTALREGWDNPNVFQMTVDLEKLHPNEKQKIRCGMAHFKQFENIEYRVVSKVSDLTN